MRLIQRLAAGMCEAKVQTLRGERTAVGQAARSRPWKLVPLKVRRLLLRGAYLDARLDAVKAEIERCGFATGYNWKEVHAQGAISYRDSYEQQRKAETVVDKRIEAIQTLKQAALRDTLGMSEVAGKKYLAKLEQRLKGI